ncbi:MAG: glycosyltransferase family 4 protein [Candidatus Sumerlaeota bacterium]|nr:glycosyltransferase family 4 protein [Candidatus Sumerlaeota bacterium]
MNAHSEKIALVTPWFGSGKGGAEVYCGGLAVALKAIGMDVEILTTCCRNAFLDWAANHLPEGVSEFGNVPVRRFPVRPRKADLFVHYYRIIDSGGGVSADQEVELLANSINSDSLYDFITANREKYLFFFLPYLYGTTYFGIRAAGRNRAFIIPCLHNESFAYLGAMQHMFQRVRGCLFLSQPERDFASALYDLTRTGQLLLGGGVSREARGNPDRFRRERRFSGPFALFVGRKVPGKGADILLSHFADYIEMHPEEELRLVMIGAGELEIPQKLRGRVVSMTAETAREVHDAMAACEFLIHPSLYESFSIVMLEAWLNRKPVLVNGECEVTLHHILRSNGGLYFTSFPEFAETVWLLRENELLCEQMGKAGERYTLDNYNWYDTAMKFHDFVQGVKGRDQ